MGLQVIKQPDDKFAIWDSVSDSLIAWDGSEQEIIDFFGNEAKKKAEQKIKGIIDSLKKDENPYYQFAISWEEAKETILDEEE